MADDSDSTQSTSEHISEHTALQIPTSALAPTSTLPISLAALPISIPFTCPHAYALPLTLVSIPGAVPVYTLFGCGHLPILQTAITAVTPTDPNVTPTDPPVTGKSIAVKTKIHELARDGFSQRKIAKILGISRGSVLGASRHLDGLVPDPGSVPNNRNIDQRRSKVKELIEQGYSYRTVARLIKKSRMTVARDLSLVRRDVTSGSESVTLGDGGDGIYGNRKIAAAALTIRKITTEVITEAETVEQEGP